MCEIIVLNHIFKEENTMTQTWKKIATVSLAAVMLTGSLAGCGQKAVSIDKENPSINVMTKAYNTCLLYTSPSPRDS